MNLITAVDLLEERTFAKELSRFLKKESIPTPKVKKSRWTLNIEGNGAHARYQIRTASGCRDLPSDRSLWTASVRKRVEMIEKLDKAAPTIVFQ